MLVGQERAAAILSRALQQGRVSHAYLFVGPEAVGKNTAALLFAQALNCERQNEFTTEITRWRGYPRHGEDGHGVSHRDAQDEQDLKADPVLPHPVDPVHPCEFPSSPSVSRVPAPAGDLRGEKLAPCGVCDSCRRIAAGTHPDVHVIVPGSKGGQNISVEQMRDVRQDVARRPIMGRRKLYLVPTAEAMNEEAANTLLKTLEEPPEYVTLVLMATSPTRVLPTVLSRCQVVPFGLAPAGAISEWLQANGVGAGAAAALAFSAAGRPGLALRWSREPEALERRRQTFQLLKETTQLRRGARQNPGEGVAALRLAERARALAGPAEGDGDRTAAAPGGRRGSREKPEPTDARTPAPPASEEGEPVARAAAKPAFMRLLELVRGYYRDLLLMAQGAPEALVWNADELGALREGVGLYTTEELVDALEAVNRCQQFLERNVAPQLALESLFLDLLQPGERTATGTALAR
jgi:DNA polymerase III subunit delta'